MNLKMRWPALISLLMAVLMLTAALSGCSKKIEPVESTEEQMRVIGTCAGQKVYYEELAFVTRTYKASLEQKYGKGIWDDPTTAAKYKAELEELVFENLKANYAIIKGCENLMDVTFAANSSLESISAYMFDGCTNLQRITFLPGSGLGNVECVHCMSFAW